MKTRKIIKSTLYLLTISLLILAVGCSNQNPVEPEVTAANSPANDYGFNIIQSNHQGFDKEFTAVKYIGPRGGKIDVGDSQHGISSLTFLPNSVTQMVRVKFWWESTGFLEGGSEFSPHGLQFVQPVLLKLSYKDADLGDVPEDSLRVYYFHEEQNYWEALPSTVVKDQKVVITWLHHFSRYALGDAP